MKAACLACIGTSTSSLFVQLPTQGVASRAFVSVCRLTQPIPFEQFSREWMNISGQDTFDGFRLEGAKQVHGVICFVSFLELTLCFHAGVESVIQSSCCVHIAGK